MSKASATVRIMGNLLRRKLEELESKKIIEEQDGNKSYAELLIEMIEKLSKYKIKKIDETDINVNLLIYNWIEYCFTYEENKWISKVY